MLRIRATTGQTLWGVIYGPSATGTIWKGGSPSAFAAYDAATPTLYAWPFIEQVGAGGAKNCWYTMAVPSGFAAADGAELTVAVVSSAGVSPTDAEIRGGADAYSGVWDTTTSTMLEESTWTARKALAQSTIAATQSTLAANLATELRDRLFFANFALGTDDGKIVINSTLSGDYNSPSDLPGVILSRQGSPLLWRVVSAVYDEALDEDTLTAVGMGHDIDLLDEVAEGYDLWSAQRPSVPSPDVVEQLQRISASTGSYGGDQVVSGLVETEVTLRPDGGTHTRVTTATGNSKELVVTSIQGE